MTKKLTSSFSSTVSQGFEHKCDFRSSVNTETVEESKVNLKQASHVINRWMEYTDYTQVILTTCSFRLKWGSDPLSSSWNHLQTELKMSEFITIKNFCSIINTRQQEYIVQCKCF